LDPLGLKVTKVEREKLVQMVPLVPLVPRALLVNLVLSAMPETVERRVLKDPRGRLALLVLKVLTATKELPVPPVRKAHKVLLVMLEL